MSSKPKPHLLPTDTTVEVTLVYPFSEEEYRKGIAAIKNGRISGIDDVLVEQQKNIGITSFKWLLDMLNKCFRESKVPGLSRQSMIIVILKPGKVSTTPKNYRPIALLCCNYAP